MRRTEETDSFLRDHFIDCKENPALSLQSIKMNIAQDHEKVLIEAGPSLQSL
jgi:hypothetical protein